MLAEIMSTAAHLYENHIWKSLQYVNELKRQEVWHQIQKPDSPEHHVVMTA